MNHGFYKSRQDYIDGGRRKLDELKDTYFPDQMVISKVYKADPDKTKTSDSNNYLITKEVNSLEFNLNGIVGSRHNSPSREINGRDSFVVPRDAIVHQERDIFLQFQIMIAE